MPRTATPSATSPAHLERLAMAVNIPAMDEYCARAYNNALVISYDRLLDALAANMVKHKGRLSWRATAPRDTGDARTYFIMSRHERPGGEYRSIGELLMLRFEIGDGEYQIWQNTFATLKEILRDSAV